MNREIIIMAVVIHPSFDHVYDYRGFEQHHYNIVIMVLFETF